MYLEHVNVTVSDLERSVRFYRDLFGFRLRWRGRTSTGAEAAHVGDERCYLALFEAVAPGRVEPDMTHVGINHLGWVVEDLDEMKRRLASLGVTPHSEQTYDPGSRLYFFDPDGIEVELVAYAPAVA